MKIQYLGNFLDLRENEKVTYTIQVQDLADVSSVNSSVTTSFRLPKTLSNYESLKSLSLPSDTSSIPYVRSSCKVYDNGTILINDGWLNVNSTDKDSYNVNIENGIIDFFKAIENKTIGKDLDLSSTNHNKDLVSVIDSFQRTDYTYIVADYNGLNTFKKGGNEYINVDFLIPSLNNKYIWDKVFTTFGFTYSGSIFQSDEFTNLWITYPKTSSVSDGGNEELPDPIVRFTSQKSSNVSYTIDEYNEEMSFRLENNTLNGVVLVDNTIHIGNDGTYKVVGNIVGSAIYRVIKNLNDNEGEDMNRGIFLAMYVNGVFTNRRESLALRANDIVRFVAVMDRPRTNEVLEVIGLGDAYVTSYNISLQQTSQSIIVFGEEFLEISISDYIKEIMIRFSLTPIINTETKHIKFITLNERLISSKLIDWTDKYIERTNESYTYKDYAVKNFFKHKYNDQDANFNNGFIYVNNQNIEAEKDLFQSKFYSYNKEVTSFYSNTFTGNSFPLWDREIKEDINNDTNVKTYSVNYKGLENRFYFIRRKNNPNTFKFGSQVLNVTAEKSNISEVFYQNLSYAEIMTRYDAFARVLTNTRIHDIDLMLDINDLLSLDLEALYYFGQENQYYILNRLTIDLSNRTSKGEFVRVQYR